MKPTRRQPTEKQLEVLNVIKNEVSSWAVTNDLSSPTLSSDIREFVYTIELDDQDEDRLIDILTDLLIFVKKLDID